MTELSKEPCNYTGEQSFIKIFGSRIELLHIRMKGLRVDDCPTGIESSTGARNRRKATVKIGRNP